MATGQDLLDRMELLETELQLQPAESDVNRGLLALNIAQDQFESMVANYPNLMGDTIGTVATSVATESTAFPTGVLRIDRLQYIDATTSRPAWDLKPIKRTGGHSWRKYWPWNVLSVSASPGKPTEYWTDGRNIYWSPLPDATHTVRWYGFQVASNITAGGTFAYPDVVMLPLAVFAVRVLEEGLDDDQTDLVSLAQQTFGPVLAALSNFDRDGAAPFEYTRVHET
jgi:hypothetical protein